MKIGSILDAEHEIPVEFWKKNFLKKYFLENGSILDAQNKNR